MKRFSAFTTAILAAICMVGCSATGGAKGSAENGLGGGYQAAVSVALGDLSADGTVRRFGDGIWEIEFASPNTLAGIKLSFNDGTAEAEYKGLSFSVPQTALPVKAMMLNLIEAVDSHSRSDELKGEEKDGMIELNGSLEGGDYTLTVDKNGDLMGFSMPNNELKMSFSDKTVLSETPDAATEASSCEVTDTVPETAENT